MIKLRESSMSTKEKRRAPRASHDSVLEIFDAEGNFILGIGRLINFSNVGVCFSSTKVLEKGQKLHARLRLLKEGALEVSARVVWVEKKSNTMLYGLEFDSIQKIEPSVV
jgi:PilZ domain-containing protein